MSGCIMSTTYPEKNFVLIILPRKPQKKKKNDVIEVSSMKEEFCQLRA